MQEELPALQSAIDAKKQEYDLIKGRLEADLKRLRNIRTGDMKDSMLFYLKDMKATQGEVVRLWSRYFEETTPTEQVQRGESGDIVVEGQMNE